MVGLTAAAMGLRNSAVRRLGAADLTTTVLTLTLTGLAADSSLAGGTNPRPVRRVGSVVAMFAGALLGAALVFHRGLAWPLAIACGAAAVATGVYLLRTGADRTARGSRDQLAGIRAPACASVFSCRRRAPT